MNKKTFLAKLRIKLEILEKEEIDDIINEYSDHIDNKINGGMSEKEAVSDFGDLETLSKEILSAYKIKVKSDESETKFEKFISELVENIIILFTRAFDSISKQKTSKIVTTILYVIVALVAVSILMWFVRIPFEIMYHILDSSFGIGYSGTFAFLIKGILKFIIEVLYFIISIMIVFSIIKKGVEYFNEDDIKVEPKVEKVLKKVKKETEKVVVEVNKKDNDKILIDVLLLIAKIFVIFTFYLPLLAFDFGMLFAIAGVLFLFTQGIYSIGLLLTVLGGAIVSMALTVLLTKFLFYKGGEK